MNTLERILLLKTDMFRSDAAFERALDLKPKTIDSWKRGNSDGYLKMISQIAKTLNTTSAYLLCETDNPAPANEKEPAGGRLEPEIMELISLYRAASPEMQAAAFGMLEAAERVRVSPDSSAEDK